MFGLSSIKLYVYAAIALAIVGLIAHDHIQTQRLHAKAGEARVLAQQRDQAKADFAAYKQAAEQDLALNRKTREALQIRLSAIERTRAAVSVRCYAASVPSAAATSGAATGAIAAPIDGGATAPLRDIGAALEDARIEALKNNSNYMGLQEWELKRR